MNNIFPLFFTFIFAYVGKGIYIYIYAWLLWFFFFFLNENITHKKVENIFCITNRETYTNWSLKVHSVHEFHPFPILYVIFISLKSIPFIIYRPSCAYITRQCSPSPTHHTSPSAHVFFNLRFTFQESFYQMHLWQTLSVLFPSLSLLTHIRWKFEV